MTEFLDVGVRKVGSGDKVVKRSIEDIADSAKQADTELKSLNKTAAWVGAGIGAALGGVAVMLFKGFTDAAKAIKETNGAAKQLGMGVENFSRLDFAARSYDLTTKDLVSTIQNLQQVQMQAAKPNSEQNKLFKQLGIEVVTTTGALRESEDVLRDVANLYQKMPDGTNKAALSMRLFGAENQEVTKLLNDGARGLDEMARKSDELGYTLDSDTSKSVSAFYDELDDVKLQVEAMYRQALPGLLPLLREFSGLLNSPEFKEGFNTLIQGAAQSVIWLAKMATQFTNTVASLSEDVAAHYGGAALDDVGRVDKELTRIESRIESLQDWKAKGRVGRAFSGLGAVDPFAKSRDATLGGVQGNAEVAAQKELNILTARRGMLLQAQQENAATAYAAADKLERDRVEQMKKDLKANEDAAAMTAPTIDFTKLGRGGAGAKGPDPAKELERFERQLHSVLSAINPVMNAEQDLAKATDVLTEAEQRGLIPKGKAAEYLATYTERLRDQLDPLGAIEDKLEEQLRVAGMLNDEREVESQLFAITEQLRRSSIKLTDEQTASLTAELEALQKLNELTEARQSILDQSSGKKMEDFGVNLEAFESIKDQLTEGDKFNWLNAALGGSLDETQSAFDARIEQLDLYYQMVQQFRDADVANATLAAEAMDEIESMKMQARIEQVQTGLGQIAKLMQSSNKTAFKIGQAAAIAQVAIATPTAAMEAFKSMQGIPYVGPVLGAAAAAAAVVYGMQQISQIRSQTPPAYRTGGSYTVGGSGGTDSQLVSMRATPGEKIHINTPAQARAIERMAEQAGGGNSRGGFVQNLTIVQQGKPDRKTGPQTAKKVRKATEKQYDRSHS